MAEALDLSVGDLESAAQELQQKNSKCVRGDKVSYANENSDMGAGDDEKERLITSHPQQETRLEAVQHHYNNQTGVIATTDGSDSTSENVFSRRTKRS